MFHPRPCRRSIQSHGLLRVMIGDASSLLLFLFFAFFRLFIIPLDIIAFAKPPWRLYSVSWCPWTVTAIKDPVPRILSLLPPRTWQFLSLFSNLELQVVWLPDAFLLQLGARANCTPRYARLVSSLVSASYRKEQSCSNAIGTNVMLCVWRDILRKVTELKRQPLTLKGVI